MNLSPKIDITNILVPFEAKLFYKGDNLGKISPKVAIISKKLNNLKNWQKKLPEKMAKCLSCQIYTKLCAGRGCHDSYRTFRNAAVDPDSTQPYLILVCLAKSSADSMGDSILSTVRNAAKLAVYEDIMINVKNHHIPATIRVEMALKTKTSC